MKPIHLPLLSLLLIPLASCTHITLLGHKSAYDVNAEFSGDPIAPVSLNAGFEGRSFAAVPPRDAVQWWKNLDPTGGLPKGDVMSTMLELKIIKVQTQGQGASGNIPFDYVTSGATGLAADAAAGADPTGSLTENTATSGTESSEAKEVSKKIKAITNSGDAAFSEQ